MKNIIYLVVLGGFWLFSACQDITVGYLETEKANYPIDTLHIMNVDQELARLKGVEEYFYSHSKELQDNIEDLNHHGYISFVEGKPNFQESVKMHCL